MTDKRGNEAELIDRQILQTQPENQGAKNFLEVSEILQLAVQHHQANHLDDAKQLYHQVLEKQPDHPEALYSLGVLAIQLGQPQTALQWLSAASQVQPDSVKTWFSLGNLHLGQQQYCEAAIAYRQALALRPDSLPIYNNLGYALQQQGLFDEAVNCYQKALDIKPDFIEAEANLGNALHAQGKLSPEKQLYYAQLNHKLGVQRKKAGDLKTAVAYYRSSIAIQPDLVEAYFSLGVALQEQGEWKETVTCYQTLLELNPHYAQAVKAYQDAETTQEVPVTPPIPQTEVTVGAYQFPAIPPVSECEKARPFWSVVITVYNRTDYLLECLTSVLAQWPGEEEMEILVMDNASQTNMFEIVNSLGKGVVRYYRNPENLGPVKNMNAGIALSRGQWIHVLHDDDYVLPGFYAQLKQSLEGSSDSVGAAFTGYEYINEKGEVLYSEEYGYGEQKGIVQDWLSNIGTICVAMLPAVVIRRATFEQLGGYNPQLPEIADWEMNKRIASFYDWWYQGAMLARYRLHSQSLSNEYWHSSWKQAAAFRKAIEISESYFPVEHCVEITAKARSHYFNAFLANAKTLLETGDICSVFRLIQEILKLDGSSQAVAKLFAWLTQDDVAPVREEIVSKLLSIPVYNNQSNMTTEKIT